MSINGGCREQAIRLLLCRYEYSYHGTNNHFVIDISYLKSKNSINVNITVSSRVLTWKVKSRAFISRCIESPVVGVSLGLF